VIVTGKLTVPAGVTTLCDGEPKLTTGATRSAVPLNVPVLELLAVSVVVTLNAKVPWA
jgi:hypothetical protein